MCVFTYFTFNFDFFFVVSCNCLEILFYDILNIYNIF